jgi:hypothetical protein
MPVYRLFRPRLVDYLIDWRPGVTINDKLAELAPYWIRAAHAENGHRPYDPYWEVEISEADHHLFRQTKWKSLEVQSDVLFTRIMAALENHTSMDQILADLRGGRRIRI